MTWKNLKTETDRERAIKKYVEINSQEFHKWLTNSLMVVVFINASAEVDCWYILIDEYRPLKRYLFAFKIPFMVIYKERSKNKPNINPLRFGDRRLIYEKK